MHIAPTSILVLLSAASARAQSDPPVARYQLADGRNALVLRSDLAQEIGMRLRHTPEGEEALAGLIDLRLIDATAAVEGVQVTRAQLDSKLRQVEEELRAQDRSLDEYVKSLGIDRTEFEQRFLRAGILQERLVMKGLSTDDPRQVTPELIKLWLRQARDRMKVETDSKALPRDVVARVAGKPIHVAELGAMLVNLANDETRQKHIRRIALRDLVHREAERLGIKVAEDDLRSEIERRRTRVEADPRFHGASYDEWLLQTQGLTVEEFVHSPHLRATVEQRLVNEKLHQDEELKAELAKDRKAILERLGEKRVLSAIMVRTTETPNEFVKRTPAIATDDLLKLRELVATSGRSFADLARVHSEDPRTKVKGGELGEFARRATDLPENILEAVFELPLFAVSAPLPIQGGMALVRVDAIIPPPDDDELIARMRDEQAERWLAAMLESAHIESLK